MAAPNDTSWGEIVSSGSSQGRIGISRTWEDKGTYEHAVINVWFWSCYNLSDSNNSYYLAVNENGVNKILRENLSKTINHTSGTAWDTANQTLLDTYEIDLNKEQSDRTVIFNSSFTGIDAIGSSNVMYAAREYTIYALESHTVSYDANGGINAPSSQTKWYGTILTLSSEIPTRPGYEFLGWGISSDDNTVDFTVGGQYGADADITLYAIWKPQNIAYYKINSTWVLCNTYIKNAGLWKPAMMHVKSNEKYIK